MYPRKEKSGKVKKYFVVIIILLLITGATYFLLQRKEGDWICKNGEWVMEGKTGKLKPQTECFSEKGESKNENEAGMPDEEFIKADSEKVAEGINIRITTPTVNATINNPIKIKGEAKGWYSEAIFPVKLVDEMGIVLGEGLASAKEDWMKDDYVPFEAEIKFDSKGLTRANLVFQKSNPSGLPENAGSFSFPVFLEK